MITVFLDMDGVLVDFVGGALDLFGSDLDIADARWNFPGQIGFTGGEDPAFWDPLGYEFWANLEWTKEGQSLLNRLETLVGHNNIGLLSSPCHTEGCAEGKRAWIKKHLPQYQKHLFLGSAKHLFASRKKILVDDHDPNVENFQKYGGQSILVPRPWNSERHLTDDKGGFELNALMDKVHGTLHKIV